MIKTLNARSWRNEFDVLIGKAVDKVGVTGWGNGAEIGMNGAKITLIDYIGEDGVHLEFDNSVILRCGECSVYLVEESE